MERTSDRSLDLGRLLPEHLSGAPISWGACEVPGWGPMPEPDHVLAEMAELGLRGTELGPPGFLPTDPSALTRLLAGYELDLVGAFLPLVLHEPSAAASARIAVQAARRLADAGGQVLVIAAVQDLGWAPPHELDDESWRRFGTHADEIAALALEHGITAVLHPHAGTLIETADQVQRALAVTEVGWCLDTGHLRIGGYHPAAFARDHGHRVRHVHLKDVDARLAARLRAGSLSLLQATRQGLFRPLGQGDAEIGAVLQALDQHGYDRWLVLEQDTALTADEPAVGSGPRFDAQRSIAFLHQSALTTEEVNP